MRAVCELKNNLSFLLAAGTISGRHRTGTGHYVIIVTILTRILVQSIKMPVRIKEHTKTKGTLNTDLTHSSIELLLHRGQQEIQEYPL